MTPEQRRINGNDAKQLLGNPMLKAAFEAVDEYLNQSALTCNPDDAEKARRIVISKQLLSAVKREIERKVQDGEMAQVQMQEIESKRKFSLFRR